MIKSFLIKLLDLLKIPKLILQMLLDQNLLFYFKKKIIIAPSQQIKVKQKKNFKKAKTNIK